MNYRLLGHSGLRVSELCLGTMTFGEDWGWGAPKEEARKIYDAFREAGGNFIDTANVYTQGSSETFLGEFMSGHRDSIVLGTKYTNAAPGTDPNAGGNQRKNMMQAIEASLRRLKTDYIDLYWLHIWDRMTPVEEVMRAFEDLVRQGKVLYVGVSDVPGWWISKANTIAAFRGWTPFVALQIEYSLIERTVERELIPVAKEFDLTVTAWSPLAGGVLSGKYASGEAADARYSGEMMKQWLPNQERSGRIVDALQNVSKQTGRSNAQIALAWLRNRSVPVIPIIGARKMHQLEDNIASLALSLTKDQTELLDDASAIELGFPYDFYAKEMATVFAYGGLRDKILA
ncbi:MAG: aldo/keto reductase [Verrucomicrobia bacterium]|nr:aldo/keto reductase [Verrucomicrobiota bacterium]